MREIKFRAWGPRKQGEFVMYSPATLNVLCEGDFPGRATTGFFWMQYTGLKDKNGNEIYEGDIVKFTPQKWVRDTGQSIGKIVFENYAFVLREDPYIKNTLCNEFGPMLEVIGNIYENFDLIPPFSDHSSSADAS